MALKTLARQLCPPILWQYAATMKGRRTADPEAQLRAAHPGPAAQDLAIYWDENWAEILEHWGEGNAWSEIQLLLVNCSGRVLDVACGTGKVMELLAPYKSLEVSGCDISDLLIRKARERGIDADRLAVMDATRMDYASGSFDYAYSIGSLEHFTEDGIAKVIDECRRVATKACFHMVPIARDGRDHGWIKTSQSYFNNSVEWWLAKVAGRYGEVRALHSSWSDAISIGKWFVCAKPENRRG